MIFEKCLVCIYLYTVCILNFVGLCVSTGRKIHGSLLLREIIFVDMVYLQVRLALLSYSKVIAIDLKKYMEIQK